MAPQAKIVLGIDDRRFVQQLRGAGTKLSTWGQRTAASVRGSLKSAFDGLSGIAGIGGALGFAAIAKSTIEFEGRLSSLGISAGKSRGEMLALGEQMGKLASATGVNRDQILAGAEAYVAATGDADGYRAAMGDLAKVQVATGSNMEDLAKISATLQQSLGVDPKQILGVFDVMSVQAKAGAVEIKDMAGELQGLAVGFSRFGEKGPAAVASLGAWMQTLKKGAPTAAEAANNLRNLMASVSGKSRQKLQDAGVRVFAKGQDGEMRALSDIMDEVLKFNPDKMTEVFGSDMQVNDAINSYRKFHDTFVSLRTPAKTAGTIMKDFDAKSQDAGQKLARMQETLKATFTNLLARNLDTIVSLVEKLVKALEWVAANPGTLLAIGAMFKGGGMLGGIPGGSAAMASVAGGIGMAGDFVDPLENVRRGPLTRAQSTNMGRWGRKDGLNAGDAGNVMRGAGMGLGVSALIKDADLLDQAMLTTMGAFAGLPGPVGMVGKSLLGLSAAILAGFRFLEGMVDDENKAVAASKFGAFYAEQARGMATGTHKEFTTGKNGMPTVVDAASYDPANMTAAQTAKAATMLNQLAKMGLLKDGQLDTAGLAKQLAGDTSLTGQDRVDLAGGSQAAYAAHQANPELRGQVRRQENSQLDDVFGMTTGAVAAMGMGTGNTTKMLNEAIGKLPQQTVNVVITTAPGIAAHVENDPKLNRGGAR